MGDSFLLTGCSQLVTLAGPDRARVREEMRELGILHDSAMLVRRGIVEAIGTRESLKGSEPEIDLSGSVVTPGLVDAHTHPIFGGNRCTEFDRRCNGATYQEIAAAGGGIKSTVRSTQEASEEELLAAGKRHAAWFLRNGTTTIEAKSGYGLSTDNELKMLRAMRRLGSETPLTVVPTFLGAHTVPSGMSKPDYVNLVIEEMLPAVTGQNLAQYCDIFCEANYFDLADSHRVLECAKSLGLGLRVHADQLTRCGGAQLAANLGAKTADHLEQTDAEGIAALAEAGVQPVLLPASVYALGLKEYPKARAMIEAGLAVVLATDFNPGSSPTPSLPAVMSLACTQMKMTPAEALVAVTLNAARSLDLSDRGTLEPGKRADFVVWDCRDYRELPYWFGIELAKRVFIEGREAFSRP